jgi:hypothetical protein
MTDRRSFVTGMTSSLSGAFLGSLTPRCLLGAGALQVTAEPTVFWAQPTGSQNLVRFAASGIEAPAGRLRVYDGSRRLLGTAGMLRSAGALRGELWLPLDRSVSVTSELEAPGVRGPHRTTHRLTPPKRWTIVWLTIAAPEDLTGALTDMPPIERAVQTAIWREAGVIANPLAAPWRLHQLDHAPFLRSDGDGQHLRRTAGIRTASVALIDDVDGYPVTTPIALAGNDVRYVVRRRGVAPYAWWSAPDGSHILAVTLPSGADPDLLGFADTPDVMATRVAAHLAALATERPLTIVAQTAVHDRLPRMVASVREWNSRYAYPRILVGGADELADTTAAAPADVSIITLPPSNLPATAPVTSLSAGVAAERTTAMRSRVDATMRPLADLLTPGDRHGDPGQRLARAIDTRVAGFVAVNPSPFRRTDVVTLPDGRRQRVTDIPAHGYAFVLDEGIAPLRIRSDAGVAPAEGQSLTVDIDPATGAVRSARDRAGRERVGAGGFNAADGAVLLSIDQEEYPGIATEFVARRYAPAIGDFSSRICVWSDSPWIDIENEVEQSEGNTFAFGFDPAVSRQRLRWEVPAGHQETTEEIPSLTHLRWLSVDGDDGSVLLRGLESAVVDVRPSGALEFRAVGNISRFRVHAVATRPSVADCTRFGWNAEPISLIPVSGNAGGSVPRFGSAVVLDHTDAAIIGWDSSVDGTAMTVFLQNLTAESRFLTLGYGVLAWSAAHRIDFQGREIDSVSGVPDGLAIQTPGWGVIAVRLTGLRVRRG